MDIVEWLANWRDISQQISKPLARPLNVAKPQWFEGICGLVTRLVFNVEQAKGTLSEVLK